MNFFRKLVGGIGKTAEVEPAPSQDDFDDAEQRLKEAVERSPHKATADITTTATALFELYSKRGDYLKATGDIEAFSSNTATSLGIFEMAAQSNYRTGWTHNAQKALNTALSYANEALRLAPSSPHARAIKAKKQELEALATAFSAELRDIEQGVANVCETLRDAGISFTNNGESIWKVRGLKAYVLALSDSVASVVYATVAPGVFGPYKHIWKQDTDVFFDLASFFGYYFGQHSLNKNFIVTRQGDTIMSVIATIWRPTTRVHAMIDRYCELMNNPQEMKERRILWWTHPKADDDNARNVVYEYIVNELVHGPDLGGDFDDPESLSPSDGMFFKMYMQEIAIEHIKKLRGVASAL